MSDSMYFKYVLMQNAQAGNADGVSLPVFRATGATLQVTGTFTGTVNFEGTQDGSVWVALRGLNLATGAIATSATAAGIYRFNVAGLDQIRTRTSSVTAGAITVRGRGYVVPTPAEMSDITVTANLSGDDTDMDTGAGVDNHDVVALGLPGAGGHVVGGTATNPIRTDPVGTTAQPITDNAGSLTVDGTVDTELPAAAALSDSADNPTTPTVGAALLGYNSNLDKWVRLRVPTAFKDLNGVAIGAIATVWTPAAGKKVRLIGGSISVSAAVSVLFEDNAAGTFVWRTPKLGSDTPHEFYLGGLGVVLAAADNVLKATSSAAANVTGTLYGVEE